MALQWKGSSNHWHAVCGPIRVVVYRFDSDSSMWFWGLRHDVDEDLAFSDLAEGHKSEFEAAKAVAIEALRALVASMLVELEP